MILFQVLFRDRIRHFSAGVGLFSRFVPLPACRGGHVRLDKPLEMYIDGFENKAIVKE